MSVDLEVRNANSGKSFPFSIKMAIETSATLYLIRSNDVHSPQKIPRAMRAEVIATLRICEKYYDFLHPRIAKSVSIKLNPLIWRVETMLSSEPDDVVYLKKMLQVMCDPEINTFIDRRKFYNSDVYERIINFALDQDAKWGNLRPLNQVLVALDGTKEGEALIARVKPMLMVARVAGKPLRFRRASLLEQIAGPAPIPKTEASATMVVNRIEDHEKSQDLLDSRLMLPGSFGTGRRR